MINPILDPIRTLKVKAAESDTNMTEVCRRANVDRSLVSNWKKKMPMSFQIYNKLIETVELIKKEKLK